MKNRISELLGRKPVFLIIWAIVAAFGTYFCTYALRKPFSTGQFLNLELFGVSYKTVLIIAQVFGYMCSKFLGIKIVSELRPESRIKLIAGLIIIAELALVGFSVAPLSYKWLFLIINGLPLGMVWGVIFSFLEGRKFTELLGLGLSVNMIMTSGILKSFYLTLQHQFHFSEFQMPFIIGLIALPFFAVFLWMLARIPVPNQEDVSLRSKRKPMNKFQKMNVLYHYGLGIFMLIISYTIFTTIRDFRDNFAVEIWNEIDPLHDLAVFGKIETFIALIVMGIIATLVFIKDNEKAYFLISGLMFASILMGGIATSMFVNHQIGVYPWMVLLGVGLFFPYLLIQIAVFERLIGLFKLKANAGFLVYLCDSLGYLGSVAVLLMKEFFWADVSWANVLIKFAMGSSVLGALLIALQFLFFVRKLNEKRGKDLQLVVK
jgi:MFS family permease